MATIESVSRGVASRKARWLVSGIAFAAMLPACGGDSSLVDAPESLSEQSIVPGPSAAPSSSAEFHPARLKSRALTLPDAASSLRALERVPEGTAQAVLVQLARNPTREERSRLKAEGLRLEQFLGLSHD